jgi:nitrate/nitrite transporter NarK
VVFTAEKGHGEAVGVAGGFYGVVVRLAFVFQIGDGAVPGVAAAFYGNKRGPKGACGGVGHDFLPLDLSLRLLDLKTAKLANYLFFSVHAAAHRFSTDRGT